MAIHKLKSVKILGITADEYIGSDGSIFYDDTDGVLRLSDGSTLGGFPISPGGIGGIYHLGDTDQFVDIDATSGIVTIQSGFDKSMPVYIKGGNCSDGGVGGDVIIEAGGAGLPNLGTDGVVSISGRETTIESNNNVWTFSENGVTQFPEGDGSLFIQGGEISGPEFIALTTNGRILLSTNAEKFVQWEFGKNGTLTTPLLLPTSLLCTLDEAHYTGEGSLTLDGTAWTYNLEVQVEADSTTQILSDDPVFASNPGYQVGNEFTFTEADHGIPGYSLSIIITDINDTDPEAISTGVGFSEPPVYPSTINSSGALKFTSNDHSLILGTDGSLKIDGVDVGGTANTGGITFSGNTISRNLSGPIIINSIDDHTKINTGNLIWDFAFDKLILPEGGDIVDSNGTSVLGGGSSDRITGGNGILSINGGAVQIMPAPSGNVRIYPGASSAVMSIQGSSNTRLEYVSSWDIVEDPPLQAGRNTLTQIDVSAGGVSINNNRDTGLGNDYDYTWVFDNNGNLQLPAGGDIIDSTGISVLGGGASTGDLAFVDNAMYNFGGVIVENADLSHGATAALILPSNGSTDAVQLTNTYGNIGVASGVSGSTKTWLFKNNGNLQLPGNSTLSDQEYVPASGTSLTYNQDAYGSEDLASASFISIYQGAISITDVQAGWTIHTTAGNLSIVIDHIVHNGTNYELHFSADDSVTYTQVGAFPITITSSDYSLGQDGFIKLDDGTNIWTFKSNGKLQLPAGGTVVDSFGVNIIPTNLSQFTNDLEIDANTLTGTTLAENVTSSSLTSVGTLTSLTSSGVVHITNTNDSTNADTGALQVDGGAHITKNLIAEGTIYAGVDAYSEALTNPLIVASSPSGVSGGYSQVAILNNTAEASGDFQVMVDGYDVNGLAGDTGWADLGMAGSNFSDARYTITQPGDGYVFVSGKEGSTNGGSLVLATDGSGTSNDIVFATGGFTYDKERMRFNHADNKFYIGNGDYNANLEVTGTSTFNGQVTFADGTALVTDSYGSYLTAATGKAVNVKSADGSAFFQAANDGIHIYTNNITNRWHFDTFGNIQLPAGGDIKNSSGVSVLGGSSYTLPTASTSTLGGVKVDGTTIVIDGSGVISSTVVGATILKGTWDASTNTPTLSSSLPAGVTVGWQYLVSVTGTRDIGDGSQTYTAGDIVLYDGTKWVDIPGAAGSVSSFNSRTGAITLTSGDVTTALGYTPIQNSSLSVTTNSPGTQGLSYSNGAFTFTPALDITGNAATATKLATARNINGVAFDGTGSITVTAAAGTLTGTTLNAGVTGSSLTSVGTLTNLTVTNPITGSVTGSAGSVAASALTGTTLASGVTSSSLTSVGTLANLTVTNPISGSVTGNAGTVTNGVYTTDTGTVTNTMLANSSITINGTSVSLGGSTTVTASADASTLTGTTLASNVVSSSLTSVGTLTGLTVSGTLTRSGAVSSAAWTTAGIGLKLPAATYTDTSSSGAVTNNFIHTIGAPTIASTSATTVGTAASLYIAGDPVAGTNTTISGSYSLYVGGKTTFVGTARFNGNILSGGGAAMLGFSNTTATVYADLSANGQTYHPNRTAFRVYGTGSSDWTTTSPTGGVMTNSQWTQDYQTGTALVGGTGIFTAPYAGLYSVTLQARCKDNASPQAQCLIQKTAIATSTTSTVCMLEWAANSTTTHIGTASTVKLAVGDTLKFIVSVGTIHFDQNDSYTVTFLG